MSTSISINVDQTEKGKKANTKASLEFFSNHNYFMKALTSWPEGHKKNPEQHLNIGGLTSINVGIIRSTLRIILWTDEAKSSLGILKEKFQKKNIRPIIKHGGESVTVWV